MPPMQRSYQPIKHPADAPPPRPGHPDYPLPSDKPAPGQPPRRAFFLAAALLFIVMALCHIIVWVDGVPTIE